MKIIEPSDVKKEGDLSERELRNSHIKEFQLSAHYETIMGIIQETLDKSLVRDLLSKKQGDVNEAELGRLTLVEWAANSKIESGIKSILERKYE